MCWLLKVWQAFKKVCETGNKQKLITETSNIYYICSFYFPINALKLFVVSTLNCCQNIQRPCWKIVLCMFILDWKTHENGNWCWLVLSLWLSIIWYYIYTTMVDDINMQKKSFRGMMESILYFWSFLLVCINLSCFELVVLPYKKWHHNIKIYTWKDSIFCGDFMIQDW